MTGITKLLREYATLTTAVALFGLATGVAFTGCSCDEEDETGTGTDGVASNMRSHMDLSELAHLAEVDHHGLFVDFGTPAYRKYTVGNWRSGWGSDITSGDTTATFAGRRGRFYFNVDEPGPLTVRLRLRAHGTARLTPYMNGEALSSLSFEEDNRFHDYDFSIAPEHVRQGENYLLFVFGGVTDIGGQEVSVAMDSIRVVPGSTIPAGDFTPPTYAALKANVTLDDVERGAVLAPRPTALSWYVEVPEQAKLTVGVGLQGDGNANVNVTATPEGGDSATLFTHQASSTFHDATVDLGRFAGQVVRLTLSADDGPGRVAWTAPRILVPAPSEAPNVEPAQNVVVLLIDTLRASKLRAFNRESRVQTPVLDQVAEEGVVFERAHSPENWTKPSCASVLTGLYPQSHGARTRTAVLPARANLVSEHLKSQGFRTGSFIANGYVSRAFGFDQGWDHHVNYLREERSTEAENVLGEAANWIEQNHSNGRFFAYIQTIDPHVPYDPPGEFVRMYDDRSYEGQVQPRMTPDLLEQAKRDEITFSGSDQRRLEALHDGEITQHDRQLGAFIERMQQMGLWENTLLVVTSDHGEEFHEHGSYGHGHSIFEELLHVPLMFRLPGTVPGRTRVPQSVSTVDIVPTMLALLGIEPMPTEGRNLTGFMLGQAPAGPALAFSDWLDDRRVVTSAGWKFLIRGNLTSSMFNLSADPGEQSQLEVTAHPIAARYHRIMLGQFLGASDRARWIDAEQGPGLALDREDTDVEGDLADQLRAIGYAN